VYQRAESSLHILNVLVIIFSNCLSIQSIYLLVFWCLIVIWIIIFIKFGFFTFNYFFKSTKKCRKVSL